MSAGPVGSVLDPTLHATHAFDQIVVGKRGLAEGKVEVKLRRTGEKKDIAFSTITELLAFAKRSGGITKSGTGYFDGLFER